MYRGLSLERFLLTCLSRRVYFLEHLPYHVTMKRFLFFFFRNLRSYGRYVHTGLLQVDFPFGVLKFDRCLISWLNTHTPGAIRWLVSDQFVVLQRGSFDWHVDLVSLLEWTEDEAPLHSLPKVLKQYQTQFLIA
jgi:hypothetical protein